MKRQFNYFAISQFISQVNDNARSLELHRSIIRRNPQRNQALRDNEMWVTRSAQAQKLRCPFSGGVYA